MGEAALEWLFEGGVLWGGGGANGWMDGLIGLLNRDLVGGNLVQNIG